MSKQPPDAVVKEFSLLPKVTNATMCQWLNVSQVINGGIAGIVGVSIIFPLDLVKVFGVLSCLKKWFGYFDICTLVQVRLQNQKIGGGTKIYTGMADCFRKIYKSEVGEKKKGNWIIFPAGILWHVPRLRSQYATRRTREGKIHMSEQKSLSLKW